MEQNKNDDSEDKFHVLVVDDSVTDRKIIEGLLRRSSCQVTSVNSARKALEFFGLEDDEQGLNGDNAGVSMIITDFCMPRLNGYDLLRRVKESSRVKDIPVVIMSSENVESRRNKCLSEGAEEFLLKPVQLSDIMNLKSHMFNSTSSQQQPTSTSTKRKNISDTTISPQAERRPRLSGLTVA